MEFAEVIQKPRVDGVYLWKNGEKYPVEGSIVITGHHLIFQPSQTSQNSNREAWVNLAFPMYKFVSAFIVFSCCYIKT